MKNCHVTGGPLSPPCPSLSSPLPAAERLVVAPVGLNSTSGVPVDLPPVSKGIWTVTLGKYPKPHSLLGLAVEGERTPGSVEETLALDKSFTLCIGFCACKVGEGVLADLPHSASGMLNRNFRCDCVVG